MRQLICRRTCEWLEIGYTYRAVRISYLVRLAEVAHIHIGYCKITTCYRARPDKRAQRCSVSSINYNCIQSSCMYAHGHNSRYDNYNTNLCQQPIKSTLGSIGVKVIEVIKIIISYYSIRVKL